MKSFHDLHAWYLSLVITRGPPPAGRAEDGAQGGCRGAGGCRGQLSRPGDGVSPP